MAFRTDSWGIAFKCNDAKLQLNSWGNRLSQIAKQKGEIRIITYSLPSLDYVRQQLGRRPWGIKLIAHEKFDQRAQGIRESFPEIEIRLNPATHSKIVLIEPHTIIVSSANFGSSKWHETTVSFHSKEAHDWYISNSFNPLWEKSRIV